MPASVEWMGGGEGQLPGRGKGFGQPSSAVNQITLFNSPKLIQVARSSRRSFRLGTAKSSKLVAPAAG